MKFNLTSLFLTIAVVALSIGWFTDRMVISNRFETSRKDSNVATWQETRANECVWISRNWKHYPKEFDTFVNGELLFYVCEMWRNESRIGEFCQPPDAAFKNASNALVLIECNTVDDFFEKARLKFIELDVYPEIQSDNSQEYESLRAFVSESLKPEYQSTWGDSR
jgi:hypothetical protein